jgi:hypothetical protein
MIEMGRSQGPVVDPRERRRTPRVRVLGQIHGHIVTLDIPVTIREVGLGGFSIVSPVNFPVDAVHEFRLTHDDGEMITLKGKVVHCGTASATNGVVSYITGFQFLKDTTGKSAAELGALIDKITAVLSFDV